MGSGFLFRAVGNVMNKNSYVPRVPCCRVVKSNGEIGGFLYGTRKKELILKKEGIKINKGKIIDFSKVLFIFK